MHKLLLTFDIEDFLNRKAIDALRIVLEMLKKHRLRALFFITGHMAEKISGFPEILSLLENHEIGFHSSAHSVRPIVQEYTDVNSYRQAYSISLERETAHINPLTGKTEGRGGIDFLQRLFYPKKIEAYRAPGMSWTPPHLEALADLGIKFDFSSNIATSEPVHHKAITFYPYTFIQQWEGSLHDYQIFLSAILRRKIAVFDLHPALYVNRIMWDSIYYKGNPLNLQTIPERLPKDITSLFRGFELLLQRLSLLHHARMIGVDPHLVASIKDLVISEGNVQRCYEASIAWSRKFFGYNPRCVRHHFQEFFESACC